MGYTIRYGQDCSAELRWKKRTVSGVKKWGAVALVIGIVLAVIAIGKENVRNFLIPGNPEVTKAAFAQLANDIRGGERFEDAVTTFCREIIDHAEIPG